MCLKKCLSQLVNYSKLYGPEKICNFLKKRFLLGKPEHR